MPQLQFDGTKFNLKTVQFGRQTLTYYAAMAITYVAHPVDPIQRLNIFVPVAYFEGGTVNGYQRDTAPIFMPNTVGSYLPGPADAPGNDQWPTNQRTIIAALHQGYVVVSAGVRGRTQVDATGSNIGKAPAFIVDMKAAIRYVKANAACIPGDVKRIIVNGTSAGGALAAIIGVAGNAAYFDPMLRELGAASASDEVFAVSAYCPVHNLEHADMAYEWQFNGVTDWYRQKVVMKNRQRRFVPIQGTLTPAQQQLSGTLKADFSRYVNGLKLTDATGEALTLDAQGHGSFRELVRTYLMQAGQTAVDQGTDVHKYAGFTVVAGQVTALDLTAFFESLTRMKAVPAFDDLGLKTPENSLFGDATTTAKHFTARAQQASTVPAELAPTEVIKAIDPVTYLTEARSTHAVAKYWRLRQGTADRDTSFAIPVILATLLQQRGYSVDFALPWDRPHGGDYDLDQLFSWIDDCCQ